MEPKKVKRRKILDTLNLLSTEKKEEPIWEFGINNNLQKPK